MKTRIAILSLASIALTAHASAAPTFSTADFIYVETNIKTPNGNSVAGFSRTAAGLTAIPGSPFLTGGAGTQYAGVNVGPEDSDQNLIASPNHTLLFAVNSGSDSIAVFKIHRNGALSPVAGSPFPSGGNDPVSLALVDDTLFVVNKSGDPARPTTVLPNLTSFSVQPTGALVPTGETANETSHDYQSTVSLAIGASPSQVFPAPNTNLLFGADFLGGLLETFQYRFNGTLHQRAPLALPASEYAGSSAPRLPLGLWSHPYLPLLYTGYVTVAKIGVYRYDEVGRLTFLRTVPNSGAAICWIRTNYAGTRLYTSETTTNSIGVYDLTDPEAPVQIQDLPLTGVGNVLQFTLSSDQHSLYAVSSRGSTSIPDGQGNVLHTLTIDGDGRVVEKVAPVVFSLPLSTRPQGVAVVPVG